MKFKRRLRRSISGWLVLFFSVLFVTLCSIFVYASIVKTWEDNKIIIVIIMFLSILFMSILLLFLDIVRRRLTVDKKVNMILDVTEKVTMGDFNVELKPLHEYGGYDEYDIIMANIDRMVGELAKNEMLKTDFIANVSHEIKTPLAIIQNYATMMQSPSATDADRAEYCASLVSASNRLSDLVTNVLKLSKLETRTITEPIKKIRLDDMLGETVLQFEEKLDGKHINVECDFDAVTVYAERANLDILFNNLVSNAVKFSRDGGTLRVSVKEQGGKAVVAVEDNGVGMTADTGRHIFDKFYQGDRSHSKEGNGLGLALVKRVIDVIGGEITVESELGKGSKFTVRFDKGVPTGG